MAVKDRIYEHVEHLPEAMQAEVLDFIKHLVVKTERGSALTAEREWKEISLALAMHGMEDERGPAYSKNDINEQLS